MKLHRNLVNAVMEGLIEILLKKKQADITVENLLRSNSRWGGRDRRFIAENVYHIVRYTRLLEFCAETNEDDEQFLSKIIEAKFIMDGLNHSHLHLADLAIEKVLLKKEEAQHIRKIRESIPDWLDELGEKEIGNNWEKEITALNTQAKFCIRVNTLRCTKENLKHILRDEQIEFTEIEIAPDALIITTRKNLRDLTAYKSGFFEVQDVSSQLVAPLLLHPSSVIRHPSSVIIDACCGAGGKTLHLAALLKNKGKIIALDVSENKLNQLKLRAARAGAENISVQVAGEKNISALEEMADFLLLDVPCSGLGVLRRKPDAKWQLSEQFIREIQNTQSKILDEYSLMLKPNGLMVYSTCSILPSENEKQVEKFTQRQQGKFELIEEKKISPAESGFDGFYMAKLRKK